MALDQIMETIMEAIMEAITIIEIPLIAMMLETLLLKHAKLSRQLLESSSELLSESVVSVALVSLPVSCAVFVVHVEEITMMMDIKTKEMDMEMAESSLSTTIMEAEATAMAVATAMVEAEEMVEEEDIDSFPASFLKGTI